MIFFFIKSNYESFFNRNIYNMGHHAFYQINQEKLQIFLVFRKGANS
jgi:hypothetical protein